MAICFICLKSADKGHLVSHAKNRVNTLRKPNLHRTHLEINGVKRKVMLCTKCLRSVKKPQQPVTAKPVTAKSVTAKPVTAKSATA